LSSADNKSIEIITNNSFVSMRSKQIKRKTNSHNFAFLISSILLNPSINKPKASKTKQVKTEKKLSENIGGKTEDWEESITNGGYGTVSKHYGISPSVKYADYNKLFGYLGSFRAMSMYEDFYADMASTPDASGNESSREMVSKETMEKAAKYFKYFVTGDILGDIGFIPPFGANISPKEWEKYRLMSQMSIYRPLIALKRASA